MLTDVLIGFALLLFGVALTRMNQLLKRAQHRQITRLWQERERTNKDTDRLLESPARSRRLRRISGGSALQPMGESQSLRSHVRLWLAKGLLPVPPGDTWAGPGTGKLCAVCALVIAAADIEHEIGHGAGRLYAHQPCYTLWREEAATEREESDRTN
jgi:hypothetical protein